MRTCLFPLLLLAGTALPCPAQKIMQIETVNHARTIKMHVGQTLVYHMTDSDEKWERGVITGLDEQKQTFRMGLLEFPVSDIQALRLPQRRWVQIVGGNLFVFGVSWLGAAAIGDFIYNDEIDWKAAGLISGTCTPAGIFLLRPRKVKMGSRHRLRVLDITLPGVDPEAVERMGN